MLKVISVPALKDNYIWMVVNNHLGQVIVIDPGEGAAVLAFLEEHNLILSGILLTHKHADHTGGVSALLNAYPGVAVYAHPIENIALTTHPVKHDDLILVDKWRQSFKVIHVPGHTLGHVAYYADPVLFSGDTLFGAGCGRIFEGTAEEMLGSLNKLAALPDETLVYCGHEYTLANLRFALHVEPSNEDIQKRIRQTEKLRLNNVPSVPSTMDIEKKTNPFLRCTQKSIISSVQNHVDRELTSTVEVLHELREWKNKF